MKKLLGPCTQFQLEPFGYPVFWDITRDMRDNTWTPEEIRVGEDLAVFHELSASSDKHNQGKLHWFKALWGQLTAFDMLRSEDATLLSAMLFEPEEVKHFLIRLAWEERLHTESYRYVIQNLGLPETGKDSIYEMWMHVPAMKARVEYAEEVTIALESIWTDNRASGKVHLQGYEYPLLHKQEILQALIFWFLIFEKVWFMLNLSGPVQHLSRHGQFRAAAEQLWYIARDEVQHIRGGVELIRAFISEHPETLTPQFMSSIQTMYEECIELEARYVSYCASVSPLVGYPATDHIETAKFFANMGAKAVLIPEPFPNARHCFPWMSETMETKKETNFFERKVKEYRTGADLWEDGEDLGFSDSMYDHLGEIPPNWEEPK